MIRSNEEEVELRKDRTEGLSNFEQDHIGRGKSRLEIPILDSHQLKQAIRMIRGWCDSTETIIEHWDEVTPLHYHLGGIRQSLIILNKRLKELRGAGRPKKQDS
jgi:hypothetical protein